MFAFTCINANAQYSALLDFYNTNGSYPNGDLLSDGTFLYGMTWAGGTPGAGTIFKIKPDGSGYSKLFNFVNDTVHGYYPDGSLIYDGTFLYGMTSVGGASDMGTIFKIKPDGTGYLKLLDFSGVANGSNPIGSLLSDGTFLYGMTSIGGINNYGTIFKIKTDGTGYLKLLDFVISNGSYPYGSLISDGTFLYGMTSSGGTNNLGTIFKIKPDGTGYANLYNFPNAGSGPYGSLIYDGTFLYGMNSGGGTIINVNCPSGCGSIFKIKPDGTGYSILSSFAGKPDGDYPVGSLISDGTFLYGMTANGGTSNNCSANCGTLFKIKPDGTGYVKMLDFTDVPNGSRPSGSLIYSGGCLYGTTFNGGLYSYSQGTVFKYCLATGIAENTEANGFFTIYPNPSSGQFHIQVGNRLALGNEYKLEIYNIVGELVHSTSNLKPQTSNEIDLSSQPNGIYFYSVSNKNNVHQSGKFILNK